MTPYGRINPLALEAEAAAIWIRRKLTFPPFTRMRWEDGTWAARMATYGEAVRRLEGAHDRDAADRHRGPAAG